MVLFYTIYTKSAGILCIVFLWSMLRVSVCYIKGVFFVNVRVLVGNKYAVKITKQGY